jgi:hypothetical protein
VLNLPSAIAAKDGLRGHGIGGTLSAMFKSDRPSNILLSINAGVPLASRKPVVVVLGIGIFIARALDAFRSDTTLFIRKAVD